MIDFTENLRQCGARRHRQGDGAGSGPQPRAAERWRSRASKSRPRVFCNGRQCSRVRQDAGSASGVAAFARTRVIRPAFWRTRLRNGIEGLNRHETGVGCFESPARRSAWRSHLCLPPFRLPGMACSAAATCSASAPSAFASTLLPWSADAAAQPSGSAKSVHPSVDGGGVTHHESFDPKPDAPIEIRGRTLPSRRH